MNVTTEPLLKTNAALSAAVIGILEPVANVTESEILPVAPVAKANVEALPAVINLLPVPTTKSAPFGIPFTLTVTVVEGVNVTF